MRVHFIFLLGVFAAIFLFACAPAPNNATATLGSQAPAATAVPLGDDMLVIYQKKGGIAGINETLVVHQDGLLEWSMRGGAPQALQAEHAALESLRRMLEQKDFDALDNLYQALGADLFTYTITARTSNGSVKTVTTMDGAKTPAYLGQLIAMLEQLRGGTANSK